MGRPEWGRPAGVGRRHPEQGAYPALVQPGFFDYDGPPLGTATLSGTEPDGTTVISVSVPDFSLWGHTLNAVCGRCEKPMETGVRIRPAEVPVGRRGTWRHECGGSARLPRKYFLVDRQTGARYDLYEGVVRERIAVSAITQAELLRLGQAARAVQAGAPGAEDRFVRVLAEAPAPIRQLRERWTREQIIALASLIVSLVALLMPLLKDDGAVTEQQLVEIIDELVGERSDAPGQQGQSEDGAAGGAGGACADESGRPPVSATGGGDGRAPKVEDRQSVDRPEQ